MFFLSPKIERFIDQYNYRERTPFSDRQMFLNFMQVLNKTGQEILDMLLPNNLVVKLQLGAGGGSST